MHKMFNCKMPMNLQFFAEPGGDGGTGQGTGSSTGSEGNQNTPQFDYEKLANLIAGKQTVTEKSVLRGYFKQQGLSKEQMEQAISSFKQQQAQNKPDVEGMQAQITQLQASEQQAKIEQAATLEAVSLGIEPKTIPYVLKMADFSQAVGQDGKINQESLKNALNKVLEDVPGMKPQQKNASGFQFGAPGSGQGSNTDNEELKKAFGL